MDGMIGGYGMENNKQSNKKIREKMDLEYDNKEEIKYKHR